jgi:hypothetical protein
MDHQNAIRVDAYPYLSLFDRMLIDLHNAQMSGDTDAECRIRADIEADLAPREQALGLRP